MGVTGVLFFLLFVGSLVKCCGEDWNGRATLGKGKAKQYSYATRHGQDIKGFLVES
jgi:hypothetical protein